MSHANPYFDRYNNYGASAGAGMMDFNPLFSSQQQHSQQQQQYHQYQYQQQQQAQQQSAAGFSMFNQAAGGGGGKKNKKNANILRLTIPGFNDEHPVDVRFPDRQLPVCERCKKNFKTRNYCRTRDCHTNLPWSDTFICITLDHACTIGGVCQPAAAGDDNNNGATNGEKLYRGPMVAKSIPPLPFFYEGEVVNPLTNICRSCKDKNYTKTYCRSNKKHRQLPWGTVHVMISPDYDAPPSDNNNVKKDAEVSSRPSKRAKKNNGNDAVTKAKEDNKDNAADVTNKEAADAKEDEKKEQTTQDKKEGKDEATSPVKQETGKESDGEKKKEKEEEKTSKSEEDTATNTKPENTKKNEVKVNHADKFQQIPKSRTFLATVSAKKISIEWLGFDPKIESILAQIESQNVAYKIPDDPTRFGQYPSQYGGQGNTMMNTYSSQDQNHLKNEAAGGGQGYDSAYNNTMSPYSRMAATMAAQAAYYGGGPTPQEMMMMSRNGGGMGGDPTQGGNGPGGGYDRDSPYLQHSMSGMTPWGGGGGGGGSSFAHPSDMANQFDSMSRGGAGAMAAATGQDLMQSQMHARMSPSTAGHNNTDNNAGLGAQGQATQSV